LGLEKTNSFGYLAYIFKWPLKEMLAPQEGPGEAADSRGHREGLSSHLFA
jgi:hypothetical protein